MLIYPTVPVETEAKITEGVKKILAKKAFPIILGGDHSITFPVIRAYDIPLTVVHIDAHLDTTGPARKATSITLRGCFAWSSCPR